MCFFFPRTQIWACSWQFYGSIQNRKTSKSEQGLEVSIRARKRLNFCAVFSPPVHLENRWKVTIPIGSMGLGYIYIYIYIWVFPKIGVPQNGWFLMENPIKMEDLGVPLFSETSIYIYNIYIYISIYLHLQLIIMVNVGRYSIPID